ncbi:MAG TPA: hypothetical protein VF121_16090 [Thermoanaerobaculia bacterium]|nr:hypothetical protein [Thermoanaerobaculia bacterium]
MSHRLRRTLGRAALLALVAAPAAATTYVLPRDEQLVDQAALVVVGTVTDATAAGDGPLPLTELAVRVESRLKGELVAPTIRVRVLGGPAGGRRRLIVRGAPALRPGERVLLFLVPHPDGAYRPLHFALGAFHERRAAGRWLALRDLADAQALAPGGGAADEPVRDFAAFSRWIADRVAGRARRPDYAINLSPGGPLRLVEPFTFLGDQKHRWLEFDLGQQIGWFAHEDGQPGLAGGGFAEFQAAIAAWNDEPASNVGYRYDGTTTAAEGFTDFDGINAILFEDPNHEIGGTFTCWSPGNGSGVLAIGGAWSEDVVDGALVIAGADIIINDGAGCWFSTPERAEQVYGHELGHTLGLGHSCGDDGEPCSIELYREALMRATAHRDDRGAKLNGDDKAGAAFLYPEVVATSFYTLPPCRVLDTREPNGPSGGPALTSDVPRAFPVGGECGVPASAVAVAVNLTVTGATGPGHLGIYSPTGSRPTASAINFAAGQTRANNALLPLSIQSEGRLVVRPFVAEAGEVHLIVDVVGYFQ